MKIEQLSFLEPLKQVEKNYKKHEIYNATICSRCLCDKCKSNVESVHLSQEECLNQVSCFNCDECYFYGMDNERLSRHVVKFECRKYEMADYYVELRARSERGKFRVINPQFKNRSSNENSPNLKGEKYE